MENKNQKNNKTYSNNIDLNSISLLSYSNILSSSRYSLFIYIIILLIIILLERFIFLILIKITFTKYISIPIHIFVHILLIKYIITQVAFEGQNKIVSRIIIYTLGINKAMNMYKSFTSFYEELSLLNNNRDILFLNIINLTDIKEQIENIQSLINNEIDILNKIKKKFNSLTYGQKIYYNNIIDLNNLIKDENIFNFIDIIINEIKKYGADTINECPEKIKNEISLELSKKNINIQKMLFYCNSIINQIKEYIGEDSFFNYRKVINFFFNNLFSSMEQIDCELKYYYLYEEKFLITKDNCKIEYIIIKNKLNHNNTNKLMIICGPNNVPFQIFSKNNNIFKYYLDSNSDILLWNYRGFGFSEGTPSFNNLRTDVLELFDKVKKNEKYSQFAVHGISIGGIPCCHLARYRKEIKLMICDKNFGNVDTFAKSNKYGKYLYIIYKLLHIQSTDSVDNYLNSQCYKIIINETQDNSLYEVCSLKTTYASELCRKYFECNRDNNTIIENNTKLNNLSDEHKEKKRTNIYNNNKLNNITKIDYNKNFNSTNYKKITSLDKIFTFKKDKNNFIENLINISNLLNNINDEENIQYSNTQGKEKIKYSDILNLTSDFIISVFNLLESAGDTLSMLFYIDNDHEKKVFIEYFFNNFFIWGSKKTNNEYNTNNIENDFNIFIQSFKGFFDLNVIKMYQDHPLIRKIDNLYKYFNIIKNNLKYVGLNINNNFIKLIDENNNNNYENELKKLNKGNLIRLECGHFGSLSPQEVETFQKFLNESNFFESNIKNND